MHVLVIPSFYPAPGHSLTGVFFRDQARALRRRGLQVGVVYPDHRSLTGEGRLDLIQNFLRVRVTDDAGVATYLSTFPAAPKAPRLRSQVWLRQLNRLLTRYVADRGIPDLIHAHGILWAGVGAVHARLSQPVPVMITAHVSSFAEGLVRPWESGPVTEALRGADTVLAVSRALAGELARWAPEVPVEVVPNLVDTEFFSLVERPKKHEFTWLAVASLMENKGVDVLLQAFAEGFGARPNVQLRIAGDGPEDRRLKALVRQLGLIEQVTFTGRLERDAIRREMEGADAFVLPSRVETFGVVLIEAMATGLPVVATQSGGPQDIVYPEVGELVAPDEPRALAEAMVGLVQHRDKWRHRASAIRTHVDERYSEPAVTDVILRAYERATGART